MLIGYARVSTLDQGPALQLDALASAGCGKVFDDHASGRTPICTGLHGALDYVREGDVLVFCGVGFPRPNPICAAWFPQVT